MKHGLGPRGFVCNLSYFCRVEVHTDLPIKKSIGCAFGDRQSEKDCWSAGRKYFLASRTTISPFAEFVRTALGVSARSSNAYRATSLTLVAWLLALEAHRLANKHGDLKIAPADTAVNDHETNETSPTSNSDVVRDSPSEDTHSEQ